MNVSQSGQLCARRPSQRSVPASGQFWWRSRQQIWKWPAAYGYHSEVYRRPGRRISYIMVSWSKNCICENFVMSGGIRNFANVCHNLYIALRQKFCVWTILVWADTDLLVGPPKLPSKSEAIYCEPTGVRV